MNAPARLCPPIDESPFDGGACRLPSSRSAVPVAVRGDDAQRRARSRLPSNVAGRADAGGVLCTGGDVRAEAAA